MLYRIGECLVIFVLSALLIALIGLYIFAVIHENNECQEKGGQMAGSGQYQTTYVMSGKVMVPVTNEITECSK